MPEDDTETEEQIWERKLRARKKIEEDNNTKPHTDGTTTDTTSSDQEVTIFQTKALVNRTTPETTNEDDGPLKTMRHQQDQDNVLRNYKLRLLNEPYNQQLLASDPCARYKEVDVFHDDLYAQAWQSNSEDFTTIPNIPFQAEPTVTIPESPEEQLIQKDTITPDPGEPLLEPNPDEHPNDAILNANSENPENEIPPPNSPRKGKYNLRANPHQTGKMNMPIIIR